MPVVQIPYGPGSIEARLPERAVRLPGAGPATPPAVPDLAAAVAEALAAPLGSPPIRDLVRPGARVAIAFDDPTVGAFGPVRGTIVRAVLAELEAAGVNRRSVVAICANALHRKSRPHELAMMLGSELAREFGERLSCHDAEDPDNLVHLGRTEPGGHDVEVHRAVVDSDLTIYVNASHNRGFAGGWKSVCVGLSTWRSIARHHTPDGMSMSVRENRMHAVLDEMGAHLESKIEGKIFKVDCIPAGPFATARVFAGSVWETRRAVLEVMDGLYPPRRDLAGERFDALLYGVPNWSPYAIFSSMNPILTLISSGLGYLGGTVQAVGKKGCTIVMVTPCPDAWDRVHHAPYPKAWDEALTETRDPWELHRRFAPVFATDGPLIEKYRNEFAFHPVHGILATYPLARLEHAGRVIVVGAENPAVPARLGFENAATVDEALGMAAETHGPGFSLAFVEQPIVPSKPTH